MSALRVVRPGPRTTVQDGGRTGFGHLGVPVAGAVDRAALLAANVAVGNPPEAAALEAVLGGLVLVAEGSVVLAVRGAESEVSVDGVPVDTATTIALQAGQELRIGAAARGVYVYVAVAGGIVVEPVLGSRSTDTLSGLGPRPLAAGDVVPIGASETPDVDLGDFTRQASDGSFGVYRGPHLALTGDEAFDLLIASAWTVTPVSDRTGLRLSGPRLPSSADGIASEGLVPGAVQLPPDGQPIVLLANHPATGGYPVIAVVAHADLDRASQSRPGAELRFRPAQGFSG